MPLRISKIKRGTLRATRRAQPRVRRSLQPQQQEPHRRTQTSGYRSPCLPRDDAQRCSPVQDQDYPQPSPGRALPVTPVNVESGRKARSQKLASAALLASSHATPVDKKGLALGILATLAVVFALDWAQTFLITLILGIFIAYALNPLVMWLKRAKITRPWGATLVMMGMVGALVFGTYTLHGQMNNIWEQLPIAATKLSARIASIRKDQSINVQKVENAVRELEKVTASGEVPSIPGPRSPATEPANFKFGNFLWTGSVGVAGAVGQAVMVLFLVYFLLLSGDSYKRKLIRLTGPSLSSKKIAVRLLDDVNESLQRYMMVLVVTNVMVGLLTWIIFRWIELQNAGAWAVAAALLHIVPYFGPMVTAAITGMAAFMQFDSFSMALLVSGSSLTVAAIVGTFVTTWMTGKVAKMNTAAIFISLLFWAWLWGVWGMLLSFPIIVIVRVVSQHVHKLKPISELLGDS